MGCGRSDAANAEPPSDKPTVIFVLGGPGSGKGTQCDKIVKDYGFEHLSTGDLLRAEVEKGGELADKLKPIMDEGKLVTSDLLVELLKKNMKEKGWEKKKFLLDGFPRNKENIDEWNKQIKDEAFVQFVLVFDVNEETMKERLLKRGEEHGRSDDNEETIKNRFDTFKNESLPIIKSYEKKKKVKKIDASKTIDEVYEEVKKLLGPPTSTSG